METIQRGEIKKFKELLNNAFQDSNKHSHGRFQQRKRQYGDYLYAQDKDRFMSDLLEWKAGKLKI